MAEKERITITIDSEILTWLDSEVDNKVFANRSHGLEFLMQNEIDHERKNNSKSG